ncbi:unnamed protein product, partial [Meganyctiphanes norvegica]
MAYALTNSDNTLVMLVSPQLGGGRILILCLSPLNYVSGTHIHAFIKSPLLEGQRWALKVEKNQKLASCKSQLLFVGGVGTNRIFDLLSLTLSSRELNVIQLIAQGNQPYLDWISQIVPEK